MLRTINMERRSGKTTKAIELMGVEQDAILIIPHNRMKFQYPKDMQHRIIDFKNALSILDGTESTGRKMFTKAVIDEGFLADKETLAHLYYALGDRKVDVISFGTV